MQVDPMEPKLKPLGTKCLTLKYDIPLSIYTFKFNMRRYPKVKRTEHRLWTRLVGLRHDVQLWDHDRRCPTNPFNRRYQPLFSAAQIAAGLAGATAGRCRLTRSNPHL